jgi:hypothetical protein
VDLTNVIIPPFDKNPLISQKRADFLLFKSVVELMSRKEHQTLEGIIKIVSIRSSLNLGLTPTLNEAFPNQNIFFLYILIYIYYIYINLTPANRPPVIGGIIVPY